MDKSKYNIKRAVRIPQLRMEPGKEYAVKIVEQMHEEPSKGKNAEGNVTLTRVINLETGELCQILVGSVLKQLLTDEGDYVNNCYLIEVGEISGENAWRDYYLWEIDEDGASLAGA
jgi:hypothetical protein